MISSVWPPAAKFTIATIGGKVVYYGILVEDSDCNQTTYEARFAQRFEKDRDRRVYWCEDCQKPFGWQNGSIPFYGNYLYKTWPSLSELIVRHERGEVDATWLRVKCYAKRQERTEFDNVAGEMGVYSERERRNAQNAVRQKRFLFNIHSKTTVW